MNEQLDKGGVEKKIPIGRGVFTMPAPGREPNLIGSRCTFDGEVYFPKQFLCLCCGRQELEEISLSRMGTLYSFTIVRQQPPVYRGPVPYAVGLIELPEKIRLRSLLTGCDLNALKIGMKMELVVEELHKDDSGNDLVCYKFRPVTD